MYIYLDTLWHLSFYVGVCPNLKWESEPLYANAVGWGGGGWVGGGGDWEGCGCKGTLRIIHVFDKFFITSPYSELSSLH